jgi:hypothetical protein
MGSFQAEQPPAAVAVGLAIRLGIGTCGEKPPDFTMAELRKKAVYYFRLVSELNFACCGS